MSLTSCYYSGVFLSRSLGKMQALSGKSNGITPCGKNIHELFIPICLGKFQCGACAEVVLPAVAQNGNAFGYAARLLRNDPNIAFQAAGALQHPKKMPIRLKPGQDVFLFHVDVFSP